MENLIINTQSISTEQGIEVPCDNSKVNKMESLKMYQGQKYQHLNRAAGNYKFEIIKVLGSNLLSLVTELSTGKKTIENETFYFSGCITMYDYCENQYNPAIAGLSTRKWCCDSWAVPNKAMQAYIDKNHLALLALTS